MPAVIIGIHLQYILSSAGIEVIYHTGVYVVCIYICTYIIYTYILFDIQSVSAKNGFIRWFKGRLQKYTLLDIVAVIWTNQANEQVLNITYPAVSEPVEWYPYLLHSVSKPVAGCINLNCSYNQALTIALYVYIHIIYFIYMFVYGLSWSGRLFFNIQLFRLLLILPAATLSYASSSYTLL